MQRYEKEILEIISRLEPESAPVPRNAQGDPPPSDEPGDFWPQHKDQPGSTAPPNAEAYVSGICLLLVSSLVTLTFAPVMAAGLIGLALIFALVLSRRIHLARQARYDLAAHDRRWVDVIMQARTGQPGRPRKQHNPTFRSY